MSEDGQHPGRGTARFLTPAEARAFYDRMGARQDSQGFYERPAVDELVAAARFGEAHSVFELGCGTGALAVRLLEHELPPTARYRGVDLSPTMVGLARNRTASFGSRARIEETLGGPELAAPPGAFDRFVSCYVLDLLAPEDIRRVVGEAHRILEPGGLLCTAGLTEGTTPVSRFVSGVWSRLHRWSPGLVGGCRPLRLGPYLSPDDWDVERSAVVVAFGVPSEVTVARRRA